MDQKALYKDVGQRICDARNKRKPKLTQQALADSVDLTRTSIANIEKGRQKLLLHKLIEIASALQVELTSLLPSESAPPTYDLDVALKNRPRQEKNWIKTTILAANKGRADGNS